MLQPYCRFCCGAPRAAATPASHDHDGQLADVAAGSYRSTAWSIVGAQFSVAVLLGGTASPIRFSELLRGHDMLHYLWMFIVGIVVGAVARWIMPGAEPMGILMTGVLGIAGSFIGGFIARLFSKPADGAMVHPAGLILSVIGACLLLFAWSHWAR